VTDRLLGILLFLPVPLVLFLFTQLPLGVATSLGVGVAVMVTHRLYARPFALARAARRCLWCGEPAGDGPQLALVEPLGASTWRACGPAHLDSVRRVLGWAGAHARFVQVGILGALAVFLPGTLAAGLGHLGPVLPADGVAFFRLVVALTVLPLGWLASRAPAPAGELPPLPFPVHIQALIGTQAVQWLFRVISLVWLALVGLHVAARLG
jgi:hypothetical protein